MALDSVAVKTWCITIVSAVLVLVSDKGNGDHALIALVPAVAFLFIDTYYLALERRFRVSYNQFVDKLNVGTVQGVDLYAIKPAGDSVREFGNALFSFSIWPFYGTLIVVILLAKSIFFGEASS